MLNNGSDVDFSLLAPGDLAKMVGQRARALRLSTGTRQADLAAAAGVPLSTIKRFEHGANVGFEVVLRVAIVLRAEHRMANLFEEPDTRSFDDILRSQRRRYRGRKPR